MSCSISTKTKSDWDNHELKGEVKSVRHITYQAVEKFGEIQKDKRTYEKLTTFNPIGNITEENEIISEYLHVKTIYTYNDKGDLVSVDWNSGQNSGKRVYEHDVNGNMLATSFYNSDGSLDSKETFKYDENGKWSETNTYNSDGSLKFKRTYKHDSKGNVTETVLYNADGSINMKETFVYDKNGNVLEENEFNPDGSLESKTANEYDAKGNKILTKSYHGDGSLSGKIIYEYDDLRNLVKEIEDYKGVVHEDRYEYDAKNNWIKEIIIRNGTHPSLIEREIEYY